MQQHIRKFVLALRRAFSTKPRRKATPDQTTTSSEPEPTTALSWDNIEQVTADKPPLPLDAETHDTMALETIELEHIPATHRVYAAFFRNVTNTEFLHSQLLARNPNFNYAFLDASSIISRRHLLSAIFNALVTLLDGTLLTATAHSEVVLSLSPNSNIADSYRRWGVSPGKTQDLIVVKVVIAPSTETTSATQPVPLTPEAIWAHLSESIKGTPVPVSDEEISKSSDWTKLRKYYALNNVPLLAKIESDEGKRKEMERLAIMRMALRGL